jgi:hypothetical protein
MHVNCTNLYTMQSLKGMLWKEVDTQKYAPEGGRPKVVKRR